MDSEALPRVRKVFRTVFLLVLLPIHVIVTDAWLIVDKGINPTGHRIGATETRKFMLPFIHNAWTFGQNDDARKHNPCSVRLHGSPCDEADTEENRYRSTVVKFSELNDMDVVVYSLLDDDEQKIYFGALQEDGVLSPLSAWTDEPAFGDSIEFLVDEVDRFSLRQQTNDQREADTMEASDKGKNTIHIHHLLSEEEVSYGQRQCPRGVHNPHGEESELLYYIDQSLIDRFEIGVDLKPKLETLW